MDLNVIKTVTGLRIKNYIPKSCRLLEYKTSIMNKNLHRAVPTSGFYDEDSRSFVTYNFSKDEMLRMFANCSYSNIIWEKEPLLQAHTFSNPISTNITLTEIQEPVFNLMLYNKAPEMFVNLPTAIGKTVLGIRYVSHMNTKTLILCYRSTVLTQWEKSFKDKTNISDNQIKIITASKQLLDILDNNVDYSDVDIFLITPTLIHSFGDRYGWNKLNTILGKLHIGIKIIDEAHRQLSTTIKLNAWVNVAKTVYLSADFNQATYDMRRQFFEIFKNVPVIKLDEDTLKDLKHITAVEMKFNSYPDLKDTLYITNGGRKNRYGWDQFKYTKYSMEKGVVIDKMKNIINHIIDTDTSDTTYKILVLTNMIFAVDDIYSIIGDMNTGRSIGRYHGKVPKDEADNAKSCDIIVSTYQAFSTGIDITEPQIRHVISLCPVDYVTANQAAGRNRPIEGYKSFFWMLVDTGFDFCINNATKVVKYLSESRVGEIKVIED